MLKIKFIEEKAIAQNIANHFVSAEIRTFPYENFNSSVEWIDEGTGIIYKHGIAIGWQ